MNWSDSYLARPEDVIAFAWSAPMRELAGKVGISDVGLRKLLVSNGVVLPPQGHWNRVHAARTVPAPPVPRPRGPGEGGRIRLDARFRDLIPEAGAMAEEGPFKSAAVPEDLSDLREAELKAIGRVAVARDLSRAHPALGQLLKREAQLREQAARTGYFWDEPKWDGPLAQRQLRIIDALFRAMSRRGHAPWTRYSQGELELHVTLGDRHFQLGFGDRSNWRGGERPPAKNLPVATELTLSVDFKSRSPLVTRWSDGNQKLEQRIPQIAADLIVVGEAAFRQGLLEQREWEEERKRWALERQRAEIRKLEEKRVADLQASGELLRKAGEIRALIEQVGAAVERGRFDLPKTQLERWRAWASAHADSLDPVLSGQVLAHLYVRDLDDPITQPGLD